MFKLAYVDKAKIENSIAQQVIPEESLIVTNSEANNAELSYYDEKGNLKSIVKKTQFESFAEAQYWIAKYGNYEGETISLLENGKWNTYTVNKDGEMNQIVYQQDMVSLLNDLIIDGGSAPEA
jgi:hypothetical protein